MPDILAPSRERFFVLATAVTPSPRLRENLGVANQRLLAELGLTWPEFKERLLDERAAMKMPIDFGDLERVAGPTFLRCRGQRTAWLVRCPTGAVKWESTLSLEARRIAIPREPVIGAVD